MLISTEEPTIIPVKNIIGKIDPMILKIVENTIPAVFFAVVPDEG